MNSGCVLLVFALAFVAADPEVESVGDLDSIEEVEFSTSVDERAEKQLENINVGFRAHGEDFQLALKPNKNIKPENVPTYLIGDDGKPALQKPPVKPEVFESHEFYGSVDNGTIAVLKKSIDGKLSGHVTRNNMLFELEQTADNLFAIRKRRATPAGHSAAVDDFTDEHVVLTRGARIKRSTRINAGVEALVVIDYSLYRKFYVKNGYSRARATNELKQYFAFVIHGVDLRYQSIQDSSVNIFVTLAGYVIATSRSGSPYYENNRVTNPNGKDQVDVDPALKDFMAYISAQRSSLTEFDHAFSFSDLDFTSGGSTGVAGYAPVAGICDNRRSVSLTEAHGGFGSISTAAHELGHNLGARHDGNQGNRACPEVNHIMDPDGGRDNLQNSFLFSSCSVNDFKNTLGNKNCVADHATHGDQALWDEHMSKLPGQIYSADEQCQMLFDDTNSELCGSWIYNQKGYDLCSAIWCTTGGSNCGSKLSPAARGTDCGSDKWCIQGHCVQKDSSHMGSNTGGSSGGNGGGSSGGSSNTTPRPTTAAPTTQAPTAPSGGGSSSCQDLYDIIRYSGGEYSCPQMASHFSSMCQSSPLNGWCCNSCSGSTPSCSDNDTYRIRINYSDGRSTVEDCGGFINALPQYCSQSYYKNKCCASCAARGM